MKDLGKIPPQEIELEKAILGAVLIEKNAINDVLGIISPESFYKDSHRLIYEAVIDLYSKNEPIDLLTVTNKLRKMGKMEEAGGAFYVTELTSFVSSSANLVHHARIVAEAHMKREIISMAGLLLKESYETKSDALDIVAKAEKTIIDINSNFFNSGKARYVKQILPEAIKAIEAASKKPEGVTGIPSGIMALDKVTGGWQNSDLVVIGARSGMGKSDLAVNLVLNAAKSGYKVALYTLEMSDVQLVNRMIAVDREIERTRLRNGKLSHEDWVRLSAFSSDVAEKSMVIDDAGISHISVRSSARKLKMKEKIDMIIIDYLQLIIDSGKAKTANERVGEISRSMKLMAKELNVPVLVLSQLSRAVENRGGDKRPILSDLRDSGSIEQDADIVIFPYRPEYYGFEERSDGSSTHQLLEIDIAKHRNGSVETVDARYLEKFGKIIDWNQIEVSVKKQPETYRPDKFHTSGLSDFEKTPF